jgi:hypothetical protein
MSETGDRPWWADVEHLRPGAEADASAPTGPETTQRTRRFDRPAATATVAVAELPRALDFDFDAGLASLLDPPAEPRGEWVELDLADAPADPIADDRRAWLDDDDRASGWDLDLWSAEPAPRRDAVEPTHGTDRLVAAPATTTAPPSSAAVPRTRSTGSPAARSASRCGPSSSGSS